MYLKKKKEERKLQNISKICEGKSCAKNYTKVRVRYTRIEREREREREIEKARGSEGDSKIESKRHTIECFDGQLAVRASGEHLWH